MCRKIEVPSEILFARDGGEVIGKDDDGFYIAKTQGNKIMTTTKHYIPSAKVNETIIKWINK